MIKLIRYADEGFSPSYDTVIKTDKGTIKANGVFVFVEKVVKGALVYNFNSSLKNRDKDKRHTMNVNETTLVYALKFNLEQITFVYKLDKGRYERISLVELYNGKRPLVPNAKLELEYLVNMGIQDVKEIITVGEYKDKLDRLDSIIKQLKSENYKVGFKGNEWKFREAFLIR